MVDSSSSDGSLRGEFVMAGYLVKSPPISRALVSQWHRRWFLLMDSKLVYPLAERYVRLVYYQSEADAKRLADPKGSINLNSCLSVVSLNEPIKNYKFVFDVCTSERVYHLAADSDEERSKWVSTLRKLLPLAQHQNGTKSQVSVPKAVAAHGSPEVVKRSLGSQRQLRPLSYTGSSHSESKPRVQSRPLPPVPSCSEPSSPVDRKNRPLPPPPSDWTQQGIHIHPVGSQTSPLVQQRRVHPPAKSAPEKPPPYRRNRSDPTPPAPPTTLNVDHSSPRLSRSASPSPPVHPLLAEDYQEFVSQSPVELDATEDNYSLATAVPMHQPQTSSAVTSVVTKENKHDEDYSVLEATPVQGYDPNDKDYSHFEPNVATDSPPPPIRHSSLAPHHHSDTSLHSQQPSIQASARSRPNRQRPHSAVPDYVNMPASPDPTNEDYSHLHH